MDSIAGYSLNKRIWQKNTVINWISSSSSSRPLVRVLCSHLLNTKHVFFFLLLHPAGLFYLETNKLILIKAQGKLVRKYKFSTWEMISALTLNVNNFEGHITQSTRMEARSSGQDHIWCQTTAPNTLRCNQTGNKDDCLRNLAL